MMRKLIALAVMAMAMAAACAGSVNDQYRVAGDAAVARASCRHSMMAASFRCATRCVRLRPSGLRVRSITASGACTWCCL